jgi:methionine sulfoxide reductase catalytic subunit
VTPEAAVLSRRRALGTIAGAALAAGGAGLPGLARAAEDDDPSRHLYPAPTNPDYANAGRALTAESDATTHINFFEFSEPRFVDPCAGGRTSGRGRSASMAWWPGRSPSISTICSPK